MTHPGPKFFLYHPPTRCTAAAGLWQHLQVGRDAASLVVLGLLRQLILKSVQLPHELALIMNMSIR